LRWISVIACLFGALSFAAVAADSPKVVMWDDLVPPGPAIENPILDLDLEAREDLGFIARTRQDLELGFIDKDSEVYREALAIEAALKAGGIDVDETIRIANELEAEYQRRDKLMNPALDGQKIRMPGYALPLEFVEAGVQEFLLVPYVGACIHAPPPPPNQMVLVKLNQTYKLESLYDPVWVTGVLRIEAGKPSLSFVDGVADISVGYALDAVEIEPYR